ncbi:hypothetical protein FA15DRAFT_662091 [Coprinopsis marcescibilis]|uniref:Uncharacterized protein n=1 Tax=Coprinopsis marcescibilis TaxID=230819 RepID=A0A5C3K8X4_COPMA|nr:hypothetical protein FA15DRAFT_662091 [Coprinopsis marcescibilis]
MTTGSAQDNDGPQPTPEIHLPGNLDLTPTLATLNAPQGRRATCSLTANMKAQGLTGPDNQNPLPAPRPHGRAKRAPLNPQGSAQLDPGAGWTQDGPTAPCAHAVALPPGITTDDISKYLGPGELDSVLAELDNPYQLTPSQTPEPTDDPFLSTLNTSAAPTSVTPASEHNTSGLTTDTLGLALNIPLSAPSNNLHGPALFSDSSASIDAESTPKDDTEVSASSRNFSKPGHTTKTNSEKIELLFDSLNETVDEAADTLLLPRDDLRHFYVKYYKNQSIQKLTDKLDDDRIQFLTATFQDLDQAVANVAMMVEKSGENLVDFYHSRYTAKPRASCEYNQLLQMEKMAVAFHSVKKSATVKYQADKTSGTLKEKVDVVSALKALQGPNVSVSSREKNFANYMKDMSTLVTKAHDKHNIETLIISVGPSTHRDQNIFYFNKTPGLDEFVNTFGVSVDDFIGYACAKASNVIKLRNVVRNATQPACGLEPDSGEISPRKYEVTNILQLVNQGSETETVTATTPLPPPSNATPSSSKPKPAPQSPLGTVLMVANPPKPKKMSKEVNIEFVRDVLNEVASLVDPHFIKGVSKLPFRSLPRYLASFGCVLKMWPIPTGFPCEFKKGNPQGVKDMPALDATNFVRGLTEQGGGLILQRHDRQELLDGEHPVIISAPPILTPAQKLAVDELTRKGKQTLDRTSYLLPCGRQCYVDGRIDWDGPPALVRKPASAAPAIHASDDETDSTASRKCSSSTAIAPQDNSKKQGMAARFATPQIVVTATPSPATVTTAAVTGATTRPSSTIVSIATYPTANTASPAIPSPPAVLSTSYGPSTPTMRWKGPNLWKVWRLNLAKAMANSSVCILDIIVIFWVSAEVTLFSLFQLLGKGPLKYGLTGI